ncbi:hypothetical protein ACLOJK_017132 [Asimina triloba]
MASDLWIIEQAREELQMLESQHPNRFDYLKLELKALVSHSSCFSASSPSLPSHPDVSLSTSARTEVSSNRKKRKGRDFRQSGAKFQKSRLNAGGCGDGSKDRADIAIERAEECLRKIREMKEVLANKSKSSLFEALDGPDFLRWREKSRAAYASSPHSGSPSERRREMVRASASTPAKKGAKEEKPQTDPEAENRKRLKSLAFSKNLLSRAAAKPVSPLPPSKTLQKHQSRDIVKKGQRKNRFLFSFPGLLAPVSGGKIGELKDLGTKNPILYLDFPQGRMKLFGTIVYPKNKYLTLQFTKSSKNVTCDDCFENMVVFSESWWIGQKDENPEEVRLEFPKEIGEGIHSEFDFKGGAGATSGEMSVVDKWRKEYVEPASPENELKNDAYDDSHNLTGKTLNNAIEVTPTRQSARMVGKTFKYAESSSGDESDSTNADTSEIKEENVDGETKDCSTTVCSSPAVDNKDADVKLLPKVQQSSLKKSKEKSSSKPGALVQATISTLFEKVEEKKSAMVKKSAAAEGSTQKKQRISSSQKANQEKVRLIYGSLKNLAGLCLLQKKEASKRLTKSKAKTAGQKGITKRKYSQVEDDDIEEISSSSEAAADSDEEWTG